MAPSFDAQRWEAPADGYYTIGPADSDTELVRFAFDTERWDQEPSLPARLIWLRPGPLRIPGDTIDVFGNSGGTLDVSCPSDSHPLDSKPDTCWRCAARAATSDLGTCDDCLTFLRSHG